MVTARSLRRRPVLAAGGGGGIAGLRLPSPIEEVADERLAGRGVRLLLKRDDLIHPEIPGNNGASSNTTWQPPPRRDTPRC